MLPTAEESEDFGSYFFLFIGLFVLLFCALPLFSSLFPPFPLSILLFTGT